MTYEYVCTACHHEWEAQQSITEQPLSSCPHCKKKTAKRQVSGGAGFILKGGGWYADGYGSSSRSQGKKSEGGESKSKSSDSKDGGSKPPKKEAKSKQAAA